ncbi:MAG: hypothetical protein IIC58_11000 [Proteobacteria bacterium]|nr:hypothetical protein [Pseudomonadota bacterium]
MITRLILLFAVVAILLWLFKRLFAEDPDPRKIEHDTQSKSENMLQCKFCGVHVPESSIVITNDTPYCSQDHADRDQ